MKFTTKSLKSNPEIIKDVISLHRVNSKTLGFLPQKVFYDSVDDDRVIIAVDPNDNMVGYLLFSINKRGNFIYITHLCVSEKFRKLGIARLLIKTLIQRYSTQFKGVRATCRQDYEATKVWESLGFTVVNEKPGRRKYGSLLFIWWLDFNHEDLFSINDGTKIKAVLDSNVIYDLMEPATKKTQNSYALLSDWLTEEVDYYITDQLKNDISHQKNKILRDKSKEFISQFNLLKSDHSQYYDVFDEVKKIYKKPHLNYREESDIRHITRTINSDASYFITKDSGIIKHSKEYFDRYSLLVLRPEEFIIQFSSIINNTDYAPNRLLGTTISKKTATVNELREIPRTFYNNTKEKIREFENNVKMAVLNDKTSAILIKTNKEYLAFFTTLESEDIIEIKFFRYAKNLKNWTVLTQLVHDLIYLARDKQKLLICISEKFISDDFQLILKKFSFLNIENKFYRFVGNKVIEFEDIRDYLNESIKNIELLNLYLRILDPFLAHKGNSYQIEKFLFPIKIINSNIPCFIVPIKPKWAMNLFNAKIAEQDLFGGDERLLFNKENVYYRSAKPIVLQNNSRILWYISKDDNKYYNTMNIAASSYLEEVNIDKPKILFSKNRRLGIYKWADVFRTANNDLENKIMAFRFELNENFVSTVNINQLNQIYNHYLGKNFFYPQTPYKILEKMYIEIYSLGFKGVINEG